MNRALAMIVLLGIGAPSMADPIFFDLTNISDNTWEYSYTVSNLNNGATDIEEFTVFFALGLFENLLVSASPADWDSFVAQPDPNLPDDGFFDSFAFVAGVPPGGQLGGFGVTFNFLGFGTPGAQPFDVFDGDFNTLSSGITQSLAVAVPEPGTLELILIGLLLSVRRKNTNNSLQLAD